MSNPRQTLAQVLNFALVLSTAFMMWKGLSVFTASSSPIVVVLSGSMEPAFQRGDLLFLWNRAPRAELGEVVVYNVRGKDIPIVHRVVRTFPEVEGKTKNVKEVSEYVFSYGLCVLLLAMRFVMVTVTNNTTLLYLVLRLCLTTCS